MIKKPFSLAIFLQIALFFHLQIASAVSNITHENKKIYDVVTISEPISNIFIQCNDKSVCKKMMDRVSLGYGEFTTINRKNKEWIENEIKSNLDSINIIKEDAVSSSTNTIRIVKKLGGTAAFIGVIGNDLNGRMNRERLSNLGIISFLHTVNTDTTIVYIFIDQNGEKAMATYLGGSSSLNSTLIPLDEILKSKILIVEGYAWNGTFETREATKRAIIFAKSHGVKTALTLGATSVIAKNRNDITEMLNQFDIIFGTQDEFNELLNSGVHTSESEISKIAGKLNNISVITMGVKGALVINNNEVHKIEAEKVKKVACTVGAGDAFAGGFLYGYTQGFTLELCGRIAAQVAAQVVQRISTTLE